MVSKRLPPAKLSDDVGLMFQRYQTSSTTFRRDLGFCVAVSGTAFATAAFYNAQSRIRFLEANTYLSAGSLPSLWSDLSFIGTRLFQQLEMRNRQKAPEAEWVDKDPRFQWMPQLGRNMLKLGVVKWAKTTDAERATYGLIALNVMVFVAWRIPLKGVQAFLSRHFMDETWSHRSHTMLTSVFSHVTPLHLGANMFALYNFGPSLMELFGTEQVLALYLTCGAGASLASRHCRRLFLPTDGRPSLGASGALFGIMGALTLAQPDLRLALIFLPTMDLPARDGLAGIMLFETICILFGKMIFDHYAHLAGAIAGLVYVGADLPLRFWPRLEKAAYETLAGMKK